MEILVDKIFLTFSNSSRRSLLENAASSKFLIDKLAKVFTFLNGTKPMLMCSLYGARMPEIVWFTCFVLIDKLQICGRKDAGMSGSCELQRELTMEQRRYVCIIASRTLRLKHKPQPCEDSKAS